MSTSGSTERFTPAQLGEFLNRMLEAERAGAKALVVFLDAFARGSDGWKTLRQVQADEAHNCALLGKLLERGGSAFSHATGEFYAKAVAVEGRRRRIEYLLRGLGWAVREFDLAMPRIDDPAISATLGSMRDTHVRSIEACAAVARALRD
jgi:nitronate monooxygenase